MGNTNQAVSEEVKANVDSKIASKKVIVYSKSYCPYCKKAKNVFQKYLDEGVLSSDDYEVIEIENDPKCDEIQDYLNTLTGGRSVPRVFIDKKCIGGGDETVSYDRAGKLKQMLAKL